MQSEAASESSLETGPDKRKRAKRKRKAASFEVVFDSQRTRHLIWALVHLTVGTLLIAILGTVAKAVGIVFLALGLLRALKFVLRIGGPEASITIGEDSVALPKKLINRRADRKRFETDEIANVFYLRRSVPWFRISPVLVIEACDGSVFRYPRDWFAADADQRRVAAAINKKLGRGLPEGLVPEDGGGHQPTIQQVSRRNRAVGLFVATGGLVLLISMSVKEIIGIPLNPVVLWVLAGLCFVTGVYYLVMMPDEKGDGAAKERRESS